MLYRKKLGEAINKHFFATFSEQLKRDKAKENVAGNRSHGASSALCVLPDFQQVACVPGSFSQSTPPDVQ